LGIWFESGEKTTYSAKGGSITKSALKELQKISPKKGDMLLLIFSKTAKYMDRIDHIYSCF
jgi:hypothetical protein